MSRLHASRATIAMRLLVGGAVLTAMSAAALHTSALRQQATGPQGIHKIQHVVIIMQ